MIAVLGDRSRLAKTRGVVSVAMQAGVDGRAPIRHRYVRSRQRMETDMRGLISAVAAAAALSLACLWTVSNVLAQTGAGDRVVSRDDLSAHAQVQPKPKRPPTRLRVTPRCPYRTVALDHPPPYDCEFPGPGYVRQCSARLVQEYRPSGTVIVPRMQCWWERG